MQIYKKICKYAKKIVTLYVFFTKYQGNAKINI